MKEMKNYQVPEIQTVVIRQHLLDTVSKGENIPGDSFHAEFTDEGIDFEKEKQ